MSKNDSTTGLSCESIPESSDTLPSEGFVRLPQIIGDRRKGIVGVIPVSRSRWYDGMASGLYPEPVDLGGRIAAWRVEDIRALIQKLGK